MDRYSTAMKSSRAQPMWSISPRPSTGSNLICSSWCWASWSIPATLFSRSLATRSTPASSLCWPNAHSTNSSSSNTSRHPGKSISRCYAPCSSYSACRLVWPRRPVRATPSLSSHCRRKSAPWFRVCSRPGPISSRANSASGAKACYVRKKPRIGMRDSMR